MNTLTYDIDPATGKGLIEPLLIAWTEVADPAVAQQVINAPVGLDGRSEWMWFRLPNGDLILATYPCGDTYFETEKDDNRP